jgi:hypothetical protein
MHYTGSCHCGKIAYTVEGDLQSVMACNCSICTKRGHLLWFVPRSHLILKTPEKDISTYTFNKHVIQHRFCARCGCGTFGEAVDPKSGQAMAAINVRCLDNVDITTLKMMQFDGRSL